MTIQPPQYDPNVPEFTTDTFATTQKQLLTNFQRLYERFSVNHVPLDDATNPGNHTKTELLETEQGTGIQTDISEISIYAKNVERQTDQVFFQYQGNQPEFQYTNYQLYSLNPNPPDQIAYFTFLPGKILVYFGVFTPRANGNVLDLSPAVSRNVLSGSLCPVGNTPLPKPGTNIPTPKEGIIQGIEVVDTATVGGVAPSCYYIVMANL